MTSMDGNSFAISDALAVVVISLPLSGQLYQTADGFTLGAAINAAPVVVSNSNCSVIYVNTASPTPVDGGVEVLYQDSFQYTAQVTYNGTVVPAALSNTATISVMNYMVADANGGSWSYTSQNSSTMVLIQLGGANLLDSAFAFVVKQLPLLVTVHTYIVLCARRCLPSAAYPSCMRLRYRLLRARCTRLQVLPPSSRSPVLLFRLPLCTTRPFRTCIQTPFKRQCFLQSSTRSCSRRKTLSVSLLPRLRSVSRCRSRLCRIRSAYRWRRGTRVSGSPTARATIHCCSCTRSRRASSPRQPRSRPT